MSILLMKIRTTPHNPNPWTTCDQHDRYLVAPAFIESIILCFLQCEWTSKGHPASSNMRHIFIQTLCGGSLTRAVNTLKRQSTEVQIAVYIGNC